MMQSYRGLLGAGLVLVGATAASYAVYEPVSPEDRGQILSGGVRARAEYDDNVFTRSQETEESFKLILQPEVELNYPVNTSHVAAAYRFSYIWFDDRPMDEEDLNHDLNVGVDSMITPRLKVKAGDVFRVGQDPEVDPNNVQRLREEDFVYNSTDLGGIYSLTETLRLGLSGRYFFYRYDEQEIADVLERDVWVLGANLEKDINPQTTGVLSYRYQDVNYDVTDRDSDSHFVFGGVDYALSPQLRTHARAGFEHRTFDVSDRDDDDAPYIDVSASYILTQRTRVSAGYEMSLSETDIGRFLKSTHHGIYAKLNQEITAKLNLNVSAQYDINDYDSEDGADGSDGDEKFWRLAARLGYEITEMITAEAGYLFNDLESDFGRSYDRNRYYLGLRVFY